MALRDQTVHPGRLACAADPRVWHVGYTSASLLAGSNFFVDLARFSRRG
jgi:hypothetical protein